MQKQQQTDRTTTLKKKTAILINGPLPPPLGGMETYCQDYLKTSLPDEFDVCLCRAILIKSVFTTKGLVRFLLRCLNSCSITCVWIVMLLVKRPDIAHIHTNSWAGFYVKGVMAMLARFVRVRTVFHIHGAEFKEFYGSMSGLARRLARFLISSNHVIIVLSEQWREFFVTIGIPPEKITIMPNSVFLPSELPSTGDTDKLTVLFMSRFEKRKGIYELLELIERRRDLLEKYRFVLAGPRDYAWPEAALRIKGLGLDDTVEMPGPLVGDGKDSAYRKADIYVLQSYAEGMPIGLLEAMSYGLVCITTPVGGIGDVVENMENGLLIEPGDVEALGRCLELLVDDPDLRKRLGNNARRTVQERYNWSARAGDLKELYLKLIDQPVARQ